MRARKEKEVDEALLAREGINPHLDDRLGPLLYGQLQLPTRRIPALAQLRGNMLQGFITSSSTTSPICRHSSSASSRRSTRRIHLIGPIKLLGAVERVRGE